MRKNKCLQCKKEYEREGFIGYICDECLAEFKDLPEDKWLEVGVNRQVEYVKNAENQLPLFMPKDGRCYHCRRSLFKDLEDVVEAGCSLITGCNNCFKSYCD